MQNPFQNPAFSMTSLTSAINILPNTYGRLEQLNLMPPNPVRFRAITVEEQNGVLNLLPTAVVGIVACIALLRWRHWGQVLAIVALSLSLAVAREASSQLQEPRRAA